MDLGNYTVRGFIPIPEQRPNHPGDPTLPATVRAEIEVGAADMPGAPPAPALHATIFLSEDAASGSVADLRPLARKELIAFLREMAQAIENAPNAQGEDFWPAPPPFEPEL